MFSPIRAMRITNKKIDNFFPNKTMQKFIEMIEINQPMLI